MERLASALTNIWPHTLMLALLCVGGFAYAHNTVQVHPRLTINALKLIHDTDQNEGKYKELYETLNNDPLSNAATYPIFWGTDFLILGDDGSAYAGRSVVDGVVQEDNPVSRVRDHFYHAVTGAALTAGIQVGRPSSVVGPEWFRVSVELYGYMEGSKLDAYLILGRSIHHVEDMTSPAHVHNDAHLDLLDSELDDYEGQYVPSTLLGNTSKFSNPLFQGSVVRNIVGFSDIWSSAPASLARATYNSVIYQALLNTDTEVASGELFKMFPCDDASRPLNCLHYSETAFSPDHWTIDSVGDYYHQVSFGTVDDWWELTEFGGPAGSYYIEQSQPGDETTRIVPTQLRTNFPAAYTGAMTPNNQELVEVYAENLLVPAVEAVAGYAQWWFDIVNTPPYLKTVTVSQGNAVKYQAEWENGDIASKEVDTPAIELFRFEIAPVVVYYISKRKLTRDAAALAYLNDQSEVEILLVFNEQIDILSIEMSVNGVDLVSAATLIENVDADDPNKTNKTVRYLIPGNILTGINGKVPLIVKAKDRDNHFGSIGGDLDGSPDTPARRQSNDDNFPWHTSSTNGLDGLIGTSAYDYADGDQVHVLLFDTLKPDDGKSPSQLISVDLD